MVSRLRSCPTNTICNCKQWLRFLQIKITCRTQLRPISRLPPSCKPQSCGAPSPHTNLQGYLHMEQGMEGHAGGMIGNNICGEQHQVVAGCGLWAVAVGFGCGIFLYSYFIFLFPFLSIPPIVTFAFLVISLFPPTPHPQEGVPME